MAHAIVKQTLLDGNKSTIVKYTIKGDGASGELSLTKLFDASSFVSESLDNKIVKIHYCLNGFTAALYWDATSPVHIISLADTEPYDADFCNIGGLKNNAGVGKTGNILISTTGLATSAKDGFILLHIVDRAVTINE